MHSLSQIYICVTESEGGSCPLRSCAMQRFYSAASVELYKLSES